MGESRGRTLYRPSALRRAPGNGGDDIRLTKPAGRVPVVVQHTRGLALRVRQGFRQINLKAKYVLKALGFLNRQGFLSIFEYDGNADIAVAGVNADREVNHSQHSSLELYCFGAIVRSVLRKIPPDI